LQAAAEQAYGGDELLVGDRVMQLKNDYDKGVFNGDMGVVNSVKNGVQGLPVSGSEPNPSSSGSKYKPNCSFTVEFDKFKGMEPGVGTPAKAKKKKATTELKSLLGAVPGGDLTDIAAVVESASQKEKDPLEIPAEERAGPRRYSSSDTDGDTFDIALAYAMTVHKAQGSEYEVVIMPVVSAHAYMLTRNLLYTGLSRAKQLLILLGSEESIGKAVRKFSPNLRRTMLQQRISNEAYANLEIV